MVAAILEGGRVTIDVALLRQLAERPNTSLVAYGPVVLLKPTTVTELLDAYEERDRLRDENERAAQLAVEATHLILRLREERERLRAALERLRKRMAEPQQPIIQWDAGTWIAYIDAALEGRE